LSRSGSRNKGKNFSLYFPQGIDKFPKVWYNIYRKTIEERKKIMRVYVVYILTDYATAVYLTANKKKAQNEMNNLKGKGHITWIKPYDLSNSVGFDLDCG
jgi:hypothetical protein